MVGDLEVPLRPGPRGQVVHTTTTWLRVFPLGPSQRHDNLARLHHYLDLLLAGDESVVVEARWRSAIGEGGSRHDALGGAAAPLPRWEARSLLGDVIDNVRSLSTETTSTDVSDRLDRFKALFVLPWEALRRSLDPPPDGREQVAAAVTLSLRFVRYGGTLHIHLGLSQWSRLPKMLEGLPVEGRPDPEAMLGTVIGSFRTVAGRWQTSVGSHFWMTPYVVDRRPYRPPAYWAVAPELLRLRGPERRAFFRLAISALPEHCAVRGVEVNGGIEVWRRVKRRRAGGFRPLYLLSATRGASDNDVREAIEAISEIEARVAHSLWDAEGELQCDRQLLRAYESAVRGGSDIWDRLAMHIPSARSRELARVHRQLRLVHQTLLQGVSDVEDVATHVDEVEQEVGTAHIEARRRFEGALAETPGKSGGLGLLEAILNTGFSADLSHLVHEVSHVADRVRQRYTQLFAAVSGATDDRRVREFDVLQRWNVVLALTLAAAVVGFVATLGSDLVTDWRVVVAAVLGSALALGVIGLYVYRVVSRSARIGTSRLTDSLERTRQLLAACSTVELSLADSHLTKGWTAGPANPTEAEVLVRQRRHWLVEDERLARRFAEEWDDSVRHRFAGGPRATTEGRDRPGVEDALSRSTAEDVTVLEDRTGRWALQTLLTTERPRRLFSPAALPRLALLYRYLDCLRRHPEWVTGGEQHVDSVWVGGMAAPIEDGEVVATLLWAYPNLTRDDAERLVRDVGEAIMRTTKTVRHPPSADDVLEIIDRHLVTEGDRPSDHAPAVPADSR